MVIINNNKKRVFWLAAMLLLVPTTVSAGVYFITSEDSKGNYEQTRPCFVDYPLHGACPDNKAPQNFCPSDNRYYRTCGCDTAVYKYDSANCTGGKTLSGRSCEGKYEICACDTSKYKYDGTNCKDGKVLSGNSCGGKYEACGCTAEYTKTCTSPMIGGEAACDGKYKTCKCPSTYLTCNNGGEIGASQCTEANGTVKWSKCKPECNLSQTSCPDAYEATSSCERNGVTYYKCELCHRKGGSAEGLYYCYYNDAAAGFIDPLGFGAYGKTEVVCGNKNYRKTCGCEQGLYFTRPRVDSYQICGQSGYRGNYVDHASWYYRGYLYNGCRENGTDVSMNGCARYNCNTGYKVVQAPTSTCAVNETLCCCPKDHTGEPNSSICTRVNRNRYKPGEE